MSPTGQFSSHRWLWRWWSTERWASLLSEAGCRKMPDLKSQKHSGQRERRRELSLTEMQQKQHLIFSYSLPGNCALTGQIKPAVWGSC